jgi:hypothetical protein
MQATMLQEFKDNLAQASTHLQSMFEIVRVRAPPLHAAACAAQGAAAVRAQRQPPAPTASSQGGAALIMIITLTPGLPWLAPLQEMFAAFQESKKKRDEVQKRLDKLAEGETLAAQHEAYKRAGFWSQVQACDRVIADTEAYLSRQVRWWRRRVGAGACGAGAAQGLLWCLGALGWLSRLGLRPCVGAGRCLAWRAAPDALLLPPCPLRAEP